MLLPSENPIKCHEEVLSLQPTFPPKHFDTLPPPPPPPCLGDVQRVWMRSEFPSNPQYVLAVVVRLEGSGIHSMKFYLRVALFCGVSQFAKNMEFLLVVFSGSFLPCFLFFVFVFMLPLELCRRSSDLFLPSSPRTYRIGSRSVNVNNTHTYTHTQSRLIRGFRNKYH